MFFFFFNIYVLGVLFQFISKFPNFENVFENYLVVLLEIIVASTAMIIFLTLMYVTYVGTN